MYIHQSNPNHSKQEGTHALILVQLPYATCFPRSIITNDLFGWDDWMGERRSLLLCISTAIGPTNMDRESKASMSVAEAKSRPPPFSRRKKANARFFIPNRRQCSIAKHTRSPQATTSKRNADPAFLLFPWVFIFLFSFKKERRIRGMVGRRWMIDR